MSKHVRGHVMSEILVYLEPINSKLTLTYQHNYCYCEHVTVTLCSASTATHVKDEVNALRDFIGGTEACCSLVWHSCKVGQFGQMVHQECEAVHELRQG